MMGKKDQALGPTVCHLGCNCCIVCSTITGLHTQIDAHKHMITSTPNTNTPKLAKIKSNNTVTGLMNVPLVNKAGDDV